MIKVLLFTVALLMPGIAYAANPSASFTDQVVPAGSGPIACDIGPSYTGTIPAAAAQAGFTHCAANYDFTQTQQFTDVLGTHQWSNLNSWLDPCTRSGNAPYLWTYAGDGVPCNTAHQSITTDGGVQVLAMSYYLADAQNGVYQNEFTTSDSNTSNPTNPMPEEYYIEMVIRPSSNTCSTTDGCIYFGTSTFTTVQGNPCFVGTDMEFDNNATSNGVGESDWNWNPCGQSSGSGTCWDFGGGCTDNISVINTSYGTFGNLTTADNSDHFASCAYWAAGAVSGLQPSDFGSAWSCGEANVPMPPANNSVFHTLMRLNVTEGPEAASQGGSTWTLPQHTTYIQRITIWECAAWPTQCYTNPVITSAP